MIANEYVNHAIDYILLHINEDISVDDVASYCGFSRFYFSRMFKMETGESLYSFIKRTKLQQSAFRLKVEKNRTITDVGGDYGYTSSNYSSAFRKYYSLSPIEFRRSILKKSLKNPILHTGDITLDDFETCSAKITIEQLDDYFVVYERHKGDYGELFIHWSEFQNRYSEYITSDTLQLERTYDDPSLTHHAECLCDICLTVPRDCGLENTCVLAGGKFAVYHFCGSASLIYSVFQSIFNVWLPQSGCTIDERYGFDIYKKVDCVTGEMEIDFCIPIK